MADKQLTENEATQEFWDHLESTKTAMLGLNVPEHHHQPMTAFCEKETGLIWFYASTLTDLAQEAATLKNARLVFTSKDREVFADVTGTLTAVHSPEHIERYWSPMVAAWYPEGKEDPHLTMLCFAPSEGRVWVSKHGMVRLAFDIAKANITKTPPTHAGTVTDVHFRH